MCACVSTTASTLRGIERQPLPVALAQLLESLKQPAVDEHVRAAGFQQVLRAGDRFGRAVKRQTKPSCLSVTGCAGRALASRHEPHAAIAKHGHDAPPAINSGRTLVGRQPGPAASLGAGRSIQTSVTAASDRRPAESPGARPLSRQRSASRTDKAPCCASADRRPPRGRPKNRPRAPAPPARSRAWPVATADAHQPRRARPAPMTKRRQPSQRIAARDSAG